ncbi:MAG: FRG domain-containing protein [Dehalococcoidales bacterium]|nr:FRG domain-containing protein [Dehalococcoidales bacterium]
MSENKSFGYHQETVRGVKELIAKLESIGDTFAFRSQKWDYDLQTSLERYCWKLNLSLDACATDIEENMIRQFRRVYVGDDDDLVQNDTLYCLSLMRHYGAPARILDVTYSFYVAVYFALECAFDSIPPWTVGESTTNSERQVKCAVWCINKVWLSQTFADRYPSLSSIEKQRAAGDRDESSFLNLYMNNEQLNMALIDRPNRLHTRLNLQQGAFIIPGNIKKSLMDNMMPIDQLNLKKFICIIRIDELKDQFEHFRRMNLTRAGLFPGLDGFAQGMKYHLDYFRRYKQWRANHF